MNCCSHQWLKNCISFCWHRWIWRTLIPVNNDLKTNNTILKSKTQSIQNLLLHVTICCPVVWFQAQRCIQMISNTLSKKLSWQSINDPTSGVCLIQSRNVRISSNQREAWIKFKRINISHTHKHDTPQLNKHTLTAAAAPRQLPSESQHNSWAFLTYQSKISSEWNYHKS